MRRVQWYTTILGVVGGVIAGYDYAAAAGTMSDTASKYAETQELTDEDVRRVSHVGGVAGYYLGK